MSVAALPQRGEIPFRIDGEDYTLPSIPTREWLDALTYQPPDCWWRLLPGWLPPEQSERIIERLNTDSDPFDVDDLEKFGLTVLGARVGCDFFAAQRLVMFVRSNWMVFDGWCVEHGADPFELSIDRVVNAAYAIRMQGCEKDSDRAKVSSQTFAPPPGTRASGRRWEDDPAFTASIDLIESEWFAAALQSAKR